LSPSDLAPRPPVFAEPWQASIFALVVALHDRGVFSWPEWNQELVFVIAASDAAGRGRGPDQDGERHPEDWVAALEGLLARKEVASGAEVAEMTEAWATAFRDTPHGQPVALRPAT
jgi:nitrile hydratase accessory protein